jgi:hypothetical protein
MAFSKGALGLIVVTIALVGALLGSWAMSMDVEEKEVTKFNPLTDIAPLFQSEKTPTFTDYSPSTNYTGYYTYDSIFGNTVYFDGVDFQQTTPNNFMVQESPTGVDADTKTLDSTGAVSGAFQVYVRTLDDAKATAPYAKTLSDLISEWSYTDYGKIEIRNADSSIDWSDFTDIEGNWVAIVPVHWADANHSYAITFKNPAIPVEELQQRYDRSIIYHDPTVACRYIKSSNSVEIFYDNDMTNSAGIYSANDVYVLFGKRVDDSSYMALGDTIETMAYELPPMNYMDPSEGVELE